VQPIFLCAINNVLSGTCREDCKFCTQSIRHHADIQRYSYKTIDQIVEEAKQAKRHGALGYCLVTAGKGLDDKKTDFIAHAAQAIKAEVDNLKLIACNGTADRRELAYLKRHGIDSYNHNLETSARYYPEICQTHQWEERYATCEAVKESGLALCCGGIFGMGETARDRDDLLKALVSLAPEATPMNFYHPNPALPLKRCSITREEALSLIEKTRTLLGKKTLVMVAGGREMLFGGEEQQMFKAGANAIVIGDYLTTRGEQPIKDHEMLARLGYKAAVNCDT